MTDSIKINEQSLKMLREYIMNDPEITEEQRQNDLSTIDDVMSGLESGEYLVIDRMSIIKFAAEKKQKSKNAAFRKKLKGKGRKVKRNATEDTRSIKSLDAFDEKFMYSSEDEVRRFAEGSGITDTYKETIRYDDVWD